MPAIKNNIIPGVDDLPIAIDIFFANDGEKKPVVIYAHGFNGFKDWGNFDLIAEKFSAADFVFIKFNFSHNGTTPETPETFSNLEAFGNNNYTKQLTDLQLVVDWVCDTANPYQADLHTAAICLIGHSMGGGIARSMHNSSIAKDRQLAEAISIAQLQIN